MDIDKSTLDIFFNNDSFLNGYLKKRFNNDSLLNGYLKKDDYAISHQTIIWIRLF